MPGRGGGPLAGGFRWDGVAAGTQPGHGGSHGTVGTAEEERARAQRFLDVAGAMLVALDADGRVTLANRAACEVLGRSEADLLGRNWFETCLPVRLRDTVAQVFAALRDGAPAGTDCFENPVVRPDGSERLIAWRNTVLRDGDGRFLGTLSSGEDVTETRRAQERLRLDDERMRSLLALHAMRGATEQELIDHALEEAVRLTRSEVGYFHVIEPDGDIRLTTWSRAVLERCSSPMDLHHPIAEAGIWADSVRRGRPAVHNDYPASDGAKGLPAGHFPVTRHMSVPVLEAGRVVAVAGVGNKAEPYDEADTVQLQLFAQGVWSLVRERRSEIELRASEARFRALADQSLVGLLMLQGPALVYANETLAALVGYPIGEIASWGPGGVFRLVHPDDRERLVNYNARRTAGDPTVPSRYDFRVVTASGEVRWLDASACRIEVGGRPTITLAIVDITARKEAEERLASNLALLRRAFRGTIEAISRAVESRDPYTAGHQRRVADLARSIGTAMGCGPEVVDAIRLAAEIHDIGKIAVPTEILSKPGRLTPAEFLLIQGHARAGFEMLSPIELPWPLADIVLQHHERLDGSGYPDGLKGDAIRVEARVIAVADVVEAIASHRPYRPALGVPAAVEEVRRLRGVSLDPDAVDACLALFLERGYSLVA